MKISRKMEKLTIPFSGCAIWTIIVLIVVGCQPLVAKPDLGGTIGIAPRTALTAKFYHTDWVEGDSAYHAVTIGSNDKVYFSVGSHVPGQSAHIFEFNPATRYVRNLWDASQTLPPSGSVAQGKIHSPLAEWAGNLLACTHTSWYYRDHKNPLTGEVQKPYSGGGIFAIDKQTGKGRMIAIPFGSSAPPASIGKEMVPMTGEGLIASIFDGRRDIFYVSSWPSALFARVDVKTGEIRYYGSQQEKAETVPRTNQKYQRALRTLGLDDKGNVYGSNGRGHIWKYDLASDRISLTNVRMENATRSKLPSGVPWLNMWRTIIWDAQESAFYGIHWSTSWLFRFDPEKNRIEPITPWRAQHMLMADTNPDYAQLGLSMGSNHVLYGLVHAPAAKPGIKRSVHLITYEIDRKVFRDHGRVLSEEGMALMFAESCAVAPNGDIYTVGWVEVAPKMKGDLPKNSMTDQGQSNSLPYRIALVRIPAAQVKFERD